LLGVHVPIAGLAVLPVLLGWPLILLPVHIVFLELIIDPACSIAFEAEPGEPLRLTRARTEAGTPEEPLGLRLAKAPAVDGRRHALSIGAAAGAT
jgi:Ca2+-transporting ATPase